MRIVPDLPPCSMSESVRWVREKLAMLAGEMEKREYVEEGLVQLCSEERVAGGGEMYLEAAAVLLAELSLLALERKVDSAEKSSSHSNAPPVK